jgi:hypothetical protein
LVPLPETNNRWPRVEHPDELRNVAGRIVLAIQEFEECWRRHTLQLSLASAELHAIVGRALVEPYEKISFSPGETLGHFRENWIQNALDEFSMIWAPPNVSFQAVASIVPGNLDVLLDKERVTLRADQAFHARFWHIEITPDRYEEARDLANYILRRATNNLLSDINSINKICRHHADGRLLRLDQIRWTVKSRGIAFEHLIADILNENEPRAERASLWEDLFEWTDLRVKYPELKRNNGARIQVKLIGTEAVENDTVNNSKRRDFYVIVSPVGLANYIEQRLEKGSDELVGEDLWRCINGTPADTVELAQNLEQMFLRAMEIGPAHPLGPMARVPAAIRQLIREHVREGAFSSTALVHVETSGNPGRVPWWRRRPK